MVRTVKSKYGFWLAGLYDDFGGARSIATDTNEPSATASYNHALSHYGNPMNGEATLNPRYRWSYVERTKGNNYDSTLIGSDDAEQKLSNTGSFNWLGCDVIRQNPSDWEGKAQLQYPDGHIGNIYKYNGAGTTAYQLFINGNDTLGRYIVPLGDNDATFGRTDSKNFTVANYNNKIAGGKASDLTGDFVQRAHLAGVWLGEMTEFAHKDGGTIESPRVVFQPVRSPSGKPFLCSQSYHDSPTSHGTKSAIIYDGSLNSVKDDDVFTVRFAIRSFNGASANNGKVPPVVKISIGYDSAPTGTALDGGLTGTPEIVWSMNFSTGNGLKDSNYDYYGAWYDNSTTADSYTKYEAWIDLDFVMDYTNGKFKVYHDGTEITATNDSGGTYSSGYNMASGAGVTASDMYGWDIQAYPLTGNDHTSVTLMLDRMALYRPLTDHPAGNALPEISDFSMKSVVNGFSQVSLSLTDDPASSGGSIGTATTDYNTELTKLFSDNAIKDWLLLVFGNSTGGFRETTNRIDRPIWKGICSSMRVNQRRRSRSIELKSEDMLSLLDRQVPLWEVGQKGLNTNESNTPYWLYDAQGFNTLMYLGASPLLNLKPTVGLDVDDSYLERIDQRTQLNAGNPIQMYNDEELEYGPNSIEENYEGAGIVAFGQENTTISSTTANYTYVDVIGNPGFTTSSTLSIINSKTIAGVSVPANNIVDKQPIQVTTLSNGNQRLHFATSDLTYTPDAATKIAYAGKYTNLRLQEDEFDGAYVRNTGKWNNRAHFLYGKRWSDFKYGHPNINDPVNEAFYTFWFDGDPGLVPGDVFTIPIRSTDAGDSHTTIAGQHSCVSIEKCLNYHYGQPDRTWNSTTEDYEFSGGSPTYYWVVTTDTPYHINAETTLATQASGGATTADSNDITITSTTGFRSGTYFGELWVQTASINGTPIIYKEIDGSNMEGVLGYAEINDGLSHTPPNNESYLYGLPQVIDLTNNSPEDYIVKQGTEIGIYFDRGARHSYTYPSGTVIYLGLHGSNTQLLSGTSRVNISTARGQIIPIPTAVDKNISSKAIHARIMRDLPLSLWFQYHFGKIKKTPLVSYQIANTVVVNPSSKTIQINSATYSALSSVYSGLGEIESADGSTDTFIWKGRVSSGGNYYLIGVDYISKKHTGTNPLSDTSGCPKINILDISDDYKHVWLLWSDMRNNGRADAAGGYRKKKFGLMYPTSENYDVSLSYIDQDENSDGIMDKFTDLKLNEDIDMWDIDSTNDPSTSGAFSKPPDYTKGQLVSSVVNNGSGKLRLTGFNGTTNFVVNDYATIYNSQVHNGTYKVIATNTGTDGIDLDLAYSADTAETGGTHVAPAGGCEIELSQYQDWEDKAGAFLIIDAAKFFNLNTTINGGKSGQTAGGSTTLDDFIITVAGEPVLIDAYWREAPASFLNVGSPYETHVNESSLVTSHTTSTESIKRGNNYLLPTDITIFDNSGYGKVTAIKEAEGSNTTPTLSEFFFAWKGKNSTARTGTITTQPAYNGGALSTLDGSISSGTSTITLLNASKFADSGTGKIDDTVDDDFSWTGKSGNQLTGVTGVTSSHAGGVTVRQGQDWTAGAAYVSLVDSSATFQTWGIEKGMIIRNTTNPISASALEVEGATYYWRINKVQSETELQVSLMGYLYDGNIITMRQIETENLYGNQYGLQGIYSIPDSLRLWRLSDAYSIPEQLHDVFGTSTTNISGAITNNANTNKRKVDRAMHQAGDRFQYFNGDLSTTTYDTIQISNSLAPSYILRLMMNLEGFTRNENSGTFFDSDKFRTLWNGAVMDTWLPQTRLSCVFDINNIPNTRTMTTYNTTSTNDSYGSVVDSRSKTIWETIGKIQNSSGIGTTNGHTTNFSYLMGRDGRMEFRPKYNSGHDFSRSNLMVSDLKSDVSDRITNVRVYYRNGQDFIDYPTPEMSDTTRWKIVEHPNLYSDEEALSMAKKEYNSLKNSRMQISAEPIKDTTTEDKMLSHGKFGYIADVQRAIQGYNANTYQAKNWTYLGTGGVLFPGMVNGMDGNMYSAATGADGNPDIYQRWGKSEQIDTSSADIDWEENYYWYGANSINYAVQLVHVPAKCPTTSATSLQEMRVGVWLKTGQTGTDIDNAEFTIGFIDYTFETGTSSAKGGGCPTLAATSSGSSTVDVKDSGFYEILVPSSYSSSLNSSGAKFVISFNAEYCRALLRHRCGDYTAADILRNAHDITGISSFPSYNTESIFPLGLRKYTEMSSFADDRSEWYAPRIYVTDDLSYIPATYVKYTDAGLDLSNETLVIQQVNWSVNDRHTEDVRLRLERDESLAAGGIVSYLFPITQPGRQTASNILNGAEDSQDQPIPYQPESAYGFGVVGQDPSPQIPGGGGRQLGDGGGGASIGSSFTSNRISDATMARVKGKMALDNLTIEGGFNVLGQKKPSMAPSTIRGAPVSSNVDIRPVGGAAFAGGNGMILPVGSTSGEAFTDTSAVTSVLSGQISVPRDIVGNDISVSSTITLESNPSSPSGRGVIKVEATCLETNASVQGFCPIDAPYRRRLTEVLPLSNLDGVETPGNTIQVQIYREAGFGGDDAPNSIIIHDVSVNIRRGGVSGTSTSEQFTPRSS